MEKEGEGDGMGRQGEGGRGEMGKGGRGREEEGRRGREEGEGRKRGEGGGRQRKGGRGEKGEGGRGREEEGRRGREEAGEEKGKEMGKEVKSNYKIICNCTHYTHPPTCNSHCAAMSHIAGASYTCCLPSATATSPITSCTRAWGMSGFLPGLVIRRSFASAEIGLTTGRKEVRVAEDGGEKR